MTREEYVGQVLEIACNVLMSQDVDLFEATAEQAWNAFLYYMAHYPTSAVAQSHMIYGAFLQQCFSDLWLAVQYQACRSLGWLDE